MPLKQLVFALALVMPGTADACAVYLPLDFRDVFEADAIVVGVVSRYQADLGLARLQIAPVEVLSGDLSQWQADDGSFQAIWNNSTFGIPEEADVGLNAGPYIIALRLDGLHEGEGGDRFTGGVPGVPIAILQRDCSDPVVFSARDGAGLILRQILTTPENERQRVADDLLEYAGRIGLRLDDPVQFPPPHPRSEIGLERCRSELARCEAGKSP